VKTKSKIRLNYGIRYLIVNIISRIVVQGGPAARPAVVPSPPTSSPGRGSFSPTLSPDNPAASKKVAAATDGPSTDPV
jgi:hypothetical protein